MRIRNFPIVSLLAILFVSPAVAGPSKEIRDFVAWCTNGLTCKAETFTQDEELNGFGVERKAGPGTPVLLFFRSQAGFAEGSTVALSLDGAPAGEIPAAEFTRNDSDFLTSIDETGLVAGLLAKLKDARRLEVTYTAAKGKRTASLSLSGLAGSLTWLDEAQGRIGTVDAIVAKGDKASPEHTVRDVLSIDDLPEDLKDLYSERGNCALMEPERFGNLGAFEDQFDPVNSLLVIPCGEGGAYNQPYRVFWVTDLGEKAMALPAMGEEGPIVVAEAWNVDWDHATATLTGMFKGRGLGDCGMFDKWRLTGEEEYRTFMLVEARRKDDCDGKGGVETFPIVWPIKRK
ncbi:MAG: DUF1176 domain-containing protein [Phyllobacteriaceae bacterium]|nr:DUF1176 domain-containing protein [Phyllobacteriaceae bacterium]